MEACTGFRKGALALLLLALAGAVASCVEVPDHIRAHFAPPGPTEATNYRQGRHGLAPPAVADDPPAVDAGAAAKAPTPIPEPVLADAGEAAEPSEPSDAGQPEASPSGPDAGDGGSS